MTSIRLFHFVLFLQYIWNCLLLLCIQRQKELSVTTYDSNIPRTETMKKDDFGLDSDGFPHFDKDYPQPKSEKWGLKKMFFFESNVRQIATWRKLEMSIGETNGYKWRKHPIWLKRKENELGEKSDWFIVCYSSHLEWRGDWWEEEGSYWSVFSMQSRLFSSSRFSKWFLYILSGLYLL